MVAFGVLFAIIGWVIVYMFAEGVGANAASRDVYAPFEEMRTKPFTTTSDEWKRLDDYADHLGIRTIVFENGVVFENHNRR